MGLSLNMLNMDVDLMQHTVYLQFEVYLTGFLQS